MTRWPHVRKLAGRSVDFRETFADLTPNIRENPAGSCAQLAPTASKLPEARFCLLGVAFAAAYSCGDPEAAHSPTNFSLRAFCAHCR